MPEAAAAVPAASIALPTWQARTGATAGMLLLKKSTAHLSTSRRGSGTATMPTLGSMVQKGKLAACALAFSHSALNIVDCGRRGGRAGGCWAGVGAGQGACWEAGHTAVHSICSRLLASLG